jgi:hydrogenase maturation protease
MTGQRVLVAGVGNIFLGDDGFGVEVVRRLCQRPSREAVCVRDFGIRGLDLAYALLDGYDKVILVDAAPRGGSPGTLYLFDPQPADSAGQPSGTGLAAHDVVPTQVLSMAMALGATFPFLRVLGCEPGNVPDGHEVQVGLSPEVEAAVERAIALIEELLEPTHA